MLKSLPLAAFSQQRILEELKSWASGWCHCGKVTVDELRADQETEGASHAENESSLSGCQGRMGGQGYQLLI